MNSPFPPGVPVLIPMGQEFRNQSNPNSRDELPARVQVALEFLENLTRKTRAQIAVNDHPGGIEVVPGQQLTSYEKDAQVAACGLLENYFAGRLAVNSWENLDLEIKKSAVLSKRGSIQIRCIMCSSDGVNPNCIMCRGLGEILVYPVRNEMDKG